MDTIETAPMLGSAETCETHIGKTWKDKYLRGSRCIRVNTQTVLAFLCVVASCIVFAFWLAAPEKSRIDPAAKELEDLRRSTSDQYERLREMHSYSQRKLDRLICNGEIETRSASFVDNANLPIGDRMAVFVTGLYKGRGNASWQALESVVNHIAGGYGSDIVDVFIDMSGGTYEAPPDAEILDQIRTTVPPHMLKAVNNYSPDTLRIQAIDTTDWNRTALGSSRHVPQFQRLARLYPEVLATERIYGSRYKYMVRTRLDNVFTRTWSREKIDSALCGNSIGTSAPDMFGIDPFWITGRSQAAHMFLHFPSLFHGPFPRETLWKTMLPPREATSATYGRYSIFPEAVMLWWLSTLPNAVVTVQCDLIGPILVHFSHGVANVCGVPE